MPGWYAYNHSLEITIRNGIINAVSSGAGTQKMRFRSNTCF